MERRKLRNVEVRADQEQRTISGYAALFNSPSEDIGFTEIVREGAFADTLSRDLKADPVYLLWNHDGGKPLASTGNGTLEIREDDKGLWFSAQVGGSSWAKDAIETVKSGLLGGMSFGFQPDVDTWADGTRYLDKVDLIEISCVTWPAYSETKNQQELRRNKNMNDTLLEKRNEVLDQIEEAMGASSIDNDRIDNLQGQFDELSVRLGQSDVTFRKLGSVRAIKRAFDQPEQEPLFFRTQEEQTRSREFSDNARIEGGKPNRQYRSFGEFAIDVAKASTPGGEVSTQLRDATGMGVAMPSTGGFAVHEDFSKDLLKVVDNNSILRPLVKTYTISGDADRLKLPAIDETSRADGSRLGGVRRCIGRGKATRQATASPSFDSWKSPLKRSLVCAMQAMSSCSTPLW